jgi:uncharacterized protein (DUF302 family)
MREITMDTAGAALASGNGIECVASSRGFEQTISHCEQLIVAKGMILFAEIDFTGDANRAGLKMPRMMLLVFGNPKSGTPVMVAAPSSALDLPLKTLVSEDAEGKVWLSFNSPEYLSLRHGIPVELLANIAGIRGLVGAAAA